MPIDRKDSYSPLKQTFANLNLLNLDRGDKEGSFDGYSLTQAFKKKNQQLGVDYIRGECTDITVTSKIDSVNVITHIFLFKKRKFKKHEAENALNLR